MHRLAFQNWLSKEINKAYIGVQEKQKLFLILITFRNVGPVKDFGLLVFEMQKEDAD